MITLIAKKERRGKIVFEFSNRLSITLAKSDPRCSDYQCGSGYDENTLEDLKHELAKLAADRKLSDTLARGAKSIEQARRTLRQKGFDSVVIGETISRFVSAGFLNDSRFARQTVEYLLENNPAGRAYLRSVLCKKLVNARLAGEVVNECFAEVDEIALAEKILRKRWWRLRELTLESAQQKAYTQLARKSIGYAVGKKAFAKLAAEEVRFSDEKLESVSTVFE